MYREMFKLEPNATLRQIMQMIGNPLLRMHEMF